MPQIFVARSQESKMVHATYDSRKSGASLRSCMWEGKLLCCSSTDCYYVSLMMSWITNVHLLYLALLCPHGKCLLRWVWLCTLVYTCSAGSESEKNGLSLPRDEVSPGQSPSSAVSHPSFFLSVKMCLKIFPSIHCLYFLFSVYFQPYLLLLCIAVNWSMILKWLIN